MTRDLVSYYDDRLVALSILLAVLGSYCTIELAGRVVAARGWNRAYWLVGGATAMGVSTWAMHYTGMLALRLPIPIAYDWPTALLAFVPSFFASALGLFVASRPKMGSFRILAGSIFIGGGIVALHYTSMASMRLEATCHYSLPIVVLSAALAVLISLLSLWLMFYFRDDANGQKLSKLASAGMLGAAIVVMHYTGMAAASFTSSTTFPDLSHALSFSSFDADGIGIVCSMMLVVLLLTSLADRLQRQKEILRKIFDHIPVMISVYVEGRHLSLVNREWERVIGLSLKEIHERKLDVIAEGYPDPDDQKKVRSFMSAATGDWADFKTRVRDGRVVDTSWAGIKLSDGTLIGIGQDITERKRAEQALKATSEHLRALSASLQSAREEEGTRIARELHDELGSALTSLIWSLDEIDRIVSTDPSKVTTHALREKIATMTTLVEHTLQTVRRISSELRPSMLDDLGLAAAIEWQAQQFQARTGIICDCSLESIELSAEQSTAVFRIFQEALTNVLRHARADPG
jgi:PAS domain S-box-containing protein